MRSIKRRSAEKSIAVIIDGKDEKWYLETIKEHYPNMAMKKKSGLAGRVFKISKKSARFLTKQ